MSMPSQSWGQPPISVYKIDTDHQSLYATELDDYYGELTCSNYLGSVAVYLTAEDVEDLALFDISAGEPTVGWKDLKRELAQDGLL